MYSYAKYCIFMYQLCFCKQFDMKQIKLIEIPEIDSNIQKWMLVF